MAKLTHKILTIGLYDRRGKSNAKYTPDATCRGWHVVEAYLNSNGTALNKFPDGGISLPPGWGWNLIKTENLYDNCRIDIIYDDD